MRLGLHLKFTLLMVTLALVPMALVGYGLVAINQRGVQASVLELHTKLAQKTAERIETELRTTAEKTAAIAQILRRNLSFEDKREILRAFLEADASIRTASLVDPKGKEFLRIVAEGSGRPPALRDRAGEPGYLEAVRAGRAAMQVTGGAADPAALFYAPIRAGALLFVRTSLDPLRRQFESESVGGTGIVMLVDRSGRPLLYPHARLPAEEAGRVARWPIVATALQSAAMGSSETWDRHGRLQIGAFAPVPSMGGAVITQQSQEDAYAAVRWLRQRAFWILLAAALIAWAAAYTAADRLVRPILALTRGAEAVARGDFTAEVNLTTRDELQTLADSFNRMTVRLREYAEIHVEKLLENQEKTEAILFSIGDGIFLTDYEGRVQLANRSAKSLLGRADEDELVGEMLTELLPDPAIREVLEAVARNPHAHLSKEVPLTTGLKRRVFQVSSQPVVSPKRGKTHGLVTAFHDVTLEKGIERVKDEFVASITHDLRNPMTALRGFIRFLLNELGGPLTPAQKKMVESMDKASFRLLSMINNILDVAKIDSGKLGLKLKPLSLRDLAARVVEIMNPLAVHRNITLGIATEDPGVMVGDEDLLERVFTNLIGNAIKFTPENGKITIGLRSDAESVMGSVADTGEGIPPHYLKKLFEKYQQVEEQRRGGTGLGLAICKYIVESHLGRIWVDSQFGKGSQFSFTLPRNLAQDAKGQIHLGAKPAGRQSPDPRPQTPDP